MVRTGLLLCCALTLCIAVPVSAQVSGGAAAAPQLLNTWSARSAGGMLLVGTFTVSPDSSGAFVTGTWTLNGAGGAILAQGGWSASKSATGWSGAWRSVATGSTREYMGTWTATTSLRATARLPELFVRKSIEQVLGGTWGSAGNSGAWSIRVAPGPPR
jgi:hypothetical protein